MTFVITGGTIDSYYNTDICTAVPYDNTIIPKYLTEAVAMDTSNVKFHQVCMKDSRDITDEIRDQVIAFIENSEDTEFVITHGTYTLFETARYLETNLKRKDVKITVTGALIPLMGFAPTDGGFNIAGAMVNSKLNQPGVYVFIKGVVSKPSNELHLHS